MCRLTKSREQPTGSIEPELKPFWTGRDSVQIHSRPRDASLIIESVEALNWIHALHEDDASIRLRGMGLMTRMDIQTLPLESALDSLSLLWVS